jgi:putative ABC transport system substrate-binding protein
VPSLAHPGGSITGLSSLDTELSAKRLQLFQTTVPGITQVAVLSNTGQPALERQFREMEEAAQTLGLQLQLLEVPADPAGIPSAFDLAVRRSADAVLIIGSPFTSSQRSPIMAEALKRRLPAMGPTRAYTEAGGLMSYGANIVAQYRRAAYFVDRILKGAKPADLPVEQPMTFEFVVNMNTAKALGITFPNEIMLQVTEVIE